MNATSSLQPLVVIGAGGHAHSVIDVIESGREFYVAGLVDSRLQAGVEVMGYPVTGDESALPRLLESLKCNHVFVAVGDNFQREVVALRLSERLPGVQFPTLIHPAATVSRHATISNGCVVMAGTVINAGVDLAQCCIVNTGAVLDHDCELGMFSSVAPGVHLGGSVLIGDRSSIGIGAAVSHAISIGCDTVVGAGSVVVRNLADTAVAYGVPCKVRRSREVDEPYL